MVPATLPTVRIDIILESSNSPERIRELGELAEASGLGGVWVSNMNDARDPFINFVPLAMSTQRIRLGPIAVSPFELHPLKMASSLLTLNEVAKGRAQIVIGAGGGTAQAMGAKPVRVVRAVRECAEILRLAATGRPMRYQGELFEVKWYNPSWVRSPAPDIYIGANGPQMLKAAPRHADAIMVSDFVVDHVRRSRAIIDGTLAGAGKDPATFRLNNFWAWHVKETQEEAEREARIWLTVRGTLYPPYINEVLDPDEAALVSRNINAFIRAYNRKSDVIEGVRAEIVSRLARRCTSACAIADLDQEIERLRSFARAGLTEIALRIYEKPADTIRLLGERVVPALADA
ncbi:MAG: LLM class flavin-dependent oxidoreductase [Gammaproteobacteria bacterium]|nr:LLM class flavin-dependent oxidoreductase [Gammaproteobacteria bacterium]